MTIILIYILILDRGFFGGRGGGCLYALINKNVLPLKYKKNKKS